MQGGLRTQEIPGEGADRGALRGHCLVLAVTCSGGKQKSGAAGRWAVGGTRQVWHCRTNSAMPTATCGLPQPSAPPGDSTAKRAYPRERHVTSGHRRAAGRLGSASGSRVLGSDELLWGSTRPFCCDAMPCAHVAMSASLCPFAETRNDASPRRRAAARPAPSSWRVSAPVPSNCSSRTQTRTDPLFP